MGAGVEPCETSTECLHLEFAITEEPLIDSSNLIFSTCRWLDIGCHIHYFAWLDTGTHDSLSEASTYIEVLEKRQGLKVACLEGIAYRQGWITEERMRELAQPMLKNQYGQYLLKVIDELKETGNPNLDY